MLCCPAPVRSTCTLTLDWIVDRLGSYCCFSGWYSGSDVENREVRLSTDADNFFETAFAPSIILCN